jgi:hypothetical protein
MVNPPPVSFDVIPNPDAVRVRLAIVLTEADLLRSLLRVSERRSREEARLRRQLQRLAAQPGPAEGGDERVA